MEGDWNSSISRIAKKIPHAQLNRKTDQKIQNKNHQTVRNSEIKNVMLLRLSESEVKAVVQYTINGTAAWTLFQDSLSYVTFLFSECRVHISEIEENKRWQEKEIKKDRSFEK